MKIVIASILLFAVFSNGIFVTANSDKDNVRKRLEPADEIAPSGDVLEQLDEENDDMDQRNIDPSVEVLEKFDEENDGMNQPESAKLLLQPSMDVPADGGDCLSVHNDLRALHKDTKRLVWSSYLAHEAQKWAKHLASILTMKHSKSADRPNQGENLAYGRSSPDSSAPRTCENAIKAWYKEIKDYNWATGKSKNGKAIGHFTQLVWKESTKLGMGIATVKKGGSIYTYIVARYSPPGNWVGEYLSNVMGLKGVSSPCDKKPCKNGGTCIDKFTSYECECSDMYKGNRCQTKRACEDTFKWCSYNKATICSHADYRHYIIQCLVTCGKCTPRKTTVKPTVPAQCKDTGTYCGDYKYYICKGGGRKYQKYCKKTCNLC